MIELNIVEASWSVDASGSWLKLRPELPGQAQMVAGEFDQTAKRDHMKEYIKWYLKMKYPDWDETKLVYKKGT